MGKFRNICEANRQKKTLFTFMTEKDYKKRFVPACMVSAASMYIKAEAVKEVGLPIADYFFIRMIMSLVVGLAENILFMSFLQVKLHI